MTQNNNPDEHDLLAASGVPDGEESPFYISVGDSFNGHMITRIVMRQDLPGLHCDLWQIWVYAGGTLLCQAPYHNLECVVHLAAAEKNDG